MPRATTTALSALTILLASGSAALASPVKIEYVPFQKGADGANGDARAAGVWDVSGKTLTIEMRNTSVTTGLGAVDSASWLLATINFALPEGVSIKMSGARSVTGGNPVKSPGTRESNWGFKNGTPSGDTPDAGAFRQVITTLNGDYNGGTTIGAGALFGGRSNLAGPDGGILPDAKVAGPKKGFEDFLIFSLTLTGELTQAQLETVAYGSNVSFNSHGTFLRPIPRPEPYLPVMAPTPMAAMGALVGLGLVAARRRRG